jgi:hypothetical protein
MVVRNLQEGSRPVPQGYTSWLQYWEENSNKKAGICCAFGCSNSAEVGGHIQKRGVNDNSWYIIPICKNCNNQRGKEYNVKSNTDFVPVNPE